MFLCNDVYDQSIDMVFADLFFLFVFLPAFALCYLLAAFIDKKYLSQKLKQVNTCKNWTLVVFSLIFYAWGEPVYVFLMLLSVLVNFILGRIIDSQERHRKAALVVGLICNIGIIATFKYLGFLAQLLIDMGIPVTKPNIALPIGISFYTFQSMSYLIDVYRRVSPAQRRYRDLLLYISMFPQLIAGPIVRYETIAAEINNRHVTAQDFADGSFRFLIGLGKKVIIANQLSLVSTQFLQDGINTLSTAGAWVGLIAFTFQIYFDFSGYSDMAIGMGRCMGFHFKENFEHPYCSSTITEFWRRWHISLGSFFRDYVYIPMGGNRRHQTLNIAVVWALTGLWHGASWNFVLWGVYFGFILIFEKYVILPYVKPRCPRFLMHLYCILLFVLGWGIFYFVDLGQLTRFFAVLLGACAIKTDFISQAALFDHFWIWVAAILFSMPLRNYASKLTSRLSRGNVAVEQNIFLFARIVTSIIILVLSVALLVGATNNPFLYTRF